MRRHRVLMWHPMEMKGDVSARTRVTTYHTPHKCKGEPPFPNPPSPQIVKFSVMLLSSCPRRGMSWSYPCKCISARVCTSTCQLKNKMKERMDRVDRVDTVGWTMLLFLIFEEHCPRRDQMWWVWPHPMSVTHNHPCLPLPCPIENLLCFSTRVFPFCPFSCLYCLPDMPDMPDMPDRQKNPHTPFCPPLDHTPSVWKPRMLLLTARHNLCKCELDPTPTLPPMRRIVF